ncbi:MAG: amidohydrolase family protein [Chryseolinea sp.]
MRALQLIKSATSINAKVFHIDKEVGKILAGLKADILVVKGDPTKNISDLRNVVWVMKDGVMIK